MQDLAQEEAELIYEQKVGPSIMKVAENALLNAFQVGLQSVNNGLKNHLYHSSKNVVAETAYNGSLDD